VNKLLVSAYFCPVAYAKATFWRKMFYSDNLLLSVLARICTESAVAVGDAL